MVEGLRPQVGAEERAEHVARRHRGRHGQVPAGDPLAHTHEVGPHAALLGGEQRPGAPESGRHLVADEQGARLTAGLAEPLHIGRRGAQHARGTLHQRLDDDRGELLAMGLYGRARLVGPTRIGIARGAHDGEAQRLEDGAEHAAVAERKSADGVAVVRITEREEAGAAVDAAVDPVLERDLERLLHRNRPIRSEQEVRVLDRHDGSECLGQLDDHRVAVAQHGGVRDLAGLGGERGVELGDAVTERVDPEGRDRIEVAAAVGVDQLPALGPLYDERCVAGVGRHLGEPVPDQRRITLGPGPGLRVGLRVGMRVLLVLILGFGGAHRPIVDQRTPARPGEPLRENGAWT